MKEFQVWTEGYSTTGQHAGATYHGKFSGETFKDAVKAFSKTLPSRSKALVDLKRLTFWGCRFFDNGTDARRSFG